MPLSWNYRNTKSVVGQSVISYIAYASFHLNRSSRYCVSEEHTNRTGSLLWSRSWTTWWLFILVWDIEWVNAAGTMHLVERKQWPSVASGHSSRWARGARSRRTLGPWCNTSLRCRRSRDVVCRANTHFNLTIILSFYCTLTYVYDPRL